MNPLRRSLLSIALYVPAYPAFSCVGPSFHIRPYGLKKSPQPYAAMSAEEFLDQTYGENGWIFDNGLFIEVGSKYDEQFNSVDNIAVVPVILGSTKEALPDNRTKIGIYAEEHIPIVHQGIRLRGIKSSERRVFYIATFHIYPGAYLYLSTRLRLSLFETQELRLFCTMDAGNGKPVRVARQERVIYTGGGCSFTWYSKDNESRDE